MAVSLLFNGVPEVLRERPDTSPCVRLSLGWGSLCRALWMPTSLVAGAGARRGCRRVDANPEEVTAMIQEGGCMMMRRSVNARLLALAVMGVLLGLWGGAEFMAQHALAQTGDAAAAALLRQPAPVTLEEQ